MNEDSIVVRILCIHGFRQHPIQFKGRTRAFQKRLRQYLEHVTNGHVTCEFCFDAFGPYELPWHVDSKDGALLWEQQKRPRLGWLLTEEQYQCTGVEESSDHVDAYQYSKQTYGWDESLRVLDALLDENRYDCILGFSQGASVAASLCALEYAKTQVPRRFKCCIIISGYILSFVMDGYRERKVGIPSFHIYGDALKESQIPVAESQALADMFDQRCRKILQTSRGHLVPSSKEDVAIIGDFINEHCGHHPSQTCMHQLSRKPSDPPLEQEEHY